MKREPGIYVYFYIFPQTKTFEHLIVLTPPFLTLAILIHISVTSKIPKLFMEVYLLEHTFLYLIIQTDWNTYSDVSVLWHYHVQNCMVVYFLRIMVL